MVTARDGRPSRVTSRPLSRPPAAPTGRQNAIVYSIGWLALHSAPSSALDSPAIEPTDRSTSPPTTSIVIGSATIPIVTVLPIRNDRLTVEPKFATAVKP